MRLWRGRQSLRHGLYVASVIVLVALVASAFIVLIFRGLNTAATYVQFISVIALLSLGGTLGASPKADPPPKAGEVAGRDAPTEPNPAPAPDGVTLPPLERAEVSGVNGESDERTKASPVVPDSTPSSLSADAAGKAVAKSVSAFPWHLVLRIASVLSLTGALVVAATLIIPESSDPGNGTYETGGVMRQPLVQTAGPKPVLFEQGTSWKWLGLLSGSEMVLRYSPGGGNLNDGLSNLGGTLSDETTCPADSFATISWVIAADGNFLSTDTNYQSLDYEVDLPDHVDEIVITVTAKSEGEAPCQLGFAWDDPSIARRVPLAEPSPSPS